MTNRVTAMQEINAAIAEASPERRAAILLEVTDLLLAQSGNCTDDELSLFDNVFHYLLAEIEVEARILLANRLAPLSRAPWKIIRTLAFDDTIEVADPVLRLSDCLDDTALIENARTKSEKHLLAISRRRTLSEAVTDVLIARGDRTVALSALANKGARFSEAGFTILIRHSAKDDALAESVGKRQEIPSHLFLKLLATASDAVRLKLETEHPKASRDIHRIVAEVSNRIQARLLRETSDYTQAELHVRPKLRNGRVPEHEILAFAEAGLLAETILALALTSDLPISAVEKAMLDERTETVLTIARAIGLNWSTVKALLRIHAGPSGISASEMEQCLANFERLKPATAQQLVRFHRMHHNGGNAS